MQQPQLGCLLSVPAFAAELFSVKEILLPMQENTTDTNLPQVLPYPFCHEDFSCCLTTGRWWSSGQRCLWHTQQDPRCCRSTLGMLIQMPHHSELCPASEERLLRPPLFRDETRQDFQQLNTEASQLAILECTDRWLLLFLPPLLQAHSFSALLWITQIHVPKTSSPFSWACQLVWQEMLPFSKPPLWSFTICFVSRKNNSSLTVLILGTVSFRPTGLHRSAKFISPLPQNLPSYRPASQAGEEGQQDAAKGKKDSAQDLIEVPFYVSSLKNTAPQNSIYSKAKNICIGRTTQEWQVITSFLNWLYIFFSSQKFSKTLSVFSNQECPNLWNKEIKTKTNIRLG